MKPKLIWPLLLLALLLLAGCRNAQPSATDGPQTLSALPASWVPVAIGGGTFFNRGTTNWTPINIDDDSTTEYLLYFTYDNGQVGAIIYDQQTGATGVASATPVPLPNQPAGIYVPYQVEPSYWTRSDVPDTVGFIAPPNTSPTALGLEQVQRYPDGDTGKAGTANPNPPANAPSNNEAIIYGGANVITVLWWRNTFNGYGITQMAALGGLTTEARPAGDVLRPLETVTGQTPIAGLLSRSVLCRETRFTRTNANEPPDIVPPVYQSAVRYVESDNGIVFCFGAPPHPYYPEGVVLAYLGLDAAPPPARGAAPIDPAAGLVWSGVGAEQRAAMAALLDLDGPDVPGSPPLVVRDLRAPASVALAPNSRAPAGTPITTNACAEVVSADGRLLRRLLFDLLYQPVQEIDGTVTAEQFVITNITDITAVVLNCALIVP
jgi:hypothetical protein